MRSDFSDFDPKQVLEEAEGAFARRMLHIYRIFNALAQQKYRERGYQDLNPSHVALLAHLERGGIRIVDLATRLGTTKQFAGRLVQELVKSNCVTVEVDPRDKRATLIKGTDYGWQFLLDACEVRAEIETLFKEALGDERYGQFIAAIEILASLQIDIRSAPEPLE